MFELGSARRALTVMALLATGCGEDDLAPPSLTQPIHPEVLFLVANEVLAIQLDGTGRRSLGRVGEDRFRTGWPRFLPDGRVAVLGDKTGGIFPYVGPAAGGTFQRLTMTNVTLHDSVCGATIGGESRLVMTTTPFLPTHGTLSRVDVDASELEPVEYERDGVLLHPAPYDDGRVVVARVTREGSSVELVDIAGAAFARGQSERLALVDAPSLALSPGRLPDGRVVFVRWNPLEVADAAIGEMMVIGLDGVVRPTGLTGVVALVVVGDKIVYEAGGADRIDDLILTDLVRPPVNLTNTPYISEHLAWSD